VRKFTPEWLSRNTIIKSKADFDEDGKVDIGDFAILAEEWSISDP